MSTTSKKLPLSSIETANLQIRAETDRGHLADLAELMEANDGRWPDALPPLVVFFDGETYHLADGHHRYQAAQEAGCAEVPCIVHQGDRTAALWYACGANSDHGLRRTNEDKRRAVLLAYQLDPRLSDNAIAKRCRVSPDMANYTLRPLRKGAPLSDSDSGGEPLEPETGASATSAAAGPAPDMRTDTRGREMNVTNIGRPKAPSTSATSATAASEPAGIEAGRTVRARGTDEAGRPITSDTTARAFATLDHFADIEADLMRVARKVSALGDMPGAELYCANHLKAKQQSKDGETRGVRHYSPDLANAVRELRHWRPYATCPKCPGAARPGCDCCKGVGYVTESAWGRLPEAMRAAARPLAG